MAEEARKEQTEQTDLPRVASSEFFFLLQRLDRLDEKLSREIAKLDEKLSREIARLDEKFSREIARLDEKFSREIADLRQEMNNNVNGLHVKIDNSARWVKGFIVGALGLMIAILGLVIRLQ